MSTSLQKFRDEHGDIHPQAVTLAEDLERFAVDTIEQANTLSAMRNVIKEQIAAEEKARVEIAGPIHASWKAANDFFKKRKAPWELAERVAQKKLVAFERAQEELRLEAARQAQAAVQAAQQVQETPEAAPEAVQQAQTIARQALITATAAPQKIEGTRKRTYWKARVTDLEALVLAVADEVRAGRKDALGLLLANQSTLDNSARLQKAEGAMFPGVECYSEVSL